MSAIKPLLTACSAFAMTLGMAQFAMAADINVERCSLCHGNVVEMHKSDNHKLVACTTCHSGLEKHDQAPSKATRPGTSMDPKTCGACHADQYTSAYTVNTERVVRDSKANSNSVTPNPFFLRAMGYHGFTKEHDLPRSHKFMAIDQYVCDRAFGGRFEPKDGWMFYAMTDAGALNTWDLVKDNFPKDNAQKPRRNGTAAAANPVCWTCKSTDLMLDWAYLGDKNPNATWSRESNVVDLYRNYNHAFNCQFCHDPHNTQPRIVRDGLIQALTRTDFPTVYSQDPKHTEIEVKDFGMRGFTRKVAYMEDSDSKLMCGQCHVEYNCNPGFNPTNGEKIGMKDARTNLFPFQDVWKLEEFYDHVQFRDFKHPVTGAALIKMQHPDTETFWSSKHAKAGVQCSSCHMPKMKNKDGKTYTSHWQTSPKAYMEETCLQCHKDKTAKQLEGVIEGMHAYYNGKLREAEARMNFMFDAFDQAIALGITGEVMEKARKLHGTAHLHWEYWTAVNGAWFHNPEMARDSLAKCASTAVEATNLLRKAIAEKNAAK